MTERDPGHDQAGTGVPRWVKGFGLGGIVLLLLIVIMLLSGHGPGDHMHGLGQLLPATQQRVQTGGLVSGWL
jgi:hypothetical protein